MVCFQAVCATGAYIHAKCVYFFYIYLTLLWLCMCVPLVDKLCDEHDYLYSRLDAHLAEIKGAVENEGVLEKSVLFKNDAS